MTSVCLDRFHFFRAQKKRQLFRAVLRRTLVIKIHVGRAIEARLRHGIQARKSLISTSSSFLACKRAVHFRKGQHYIDIDPLASVNKDVVGDPPARPAARGPVLFEVWPGITHSNKHSRYILRLCFSCLAGPYRFNTIKVLLPFSSADLYRSPRLSRGGAVYKKTGCFQPVFFGSKNILCAEVHMSSPADQEVSTVPVRFSESAPLGTGRPSLVQLSSPAGPSPVIAV